MRLLDILLGAPKPPPDPPPDPLREALERANHAVREADEALDRYCEQQRRLRGNGNSRSWEELLGLCEDRPHGS